MSMLTRHSLAARSRADYFLYRLKADAAAFAKWSRAHERQSSSLSRQVLKSSADILLALDDLDQRLKRGRAKPRKKR